MYNQINIYNLHVNGMTQNANINTGHTVQNSHTANSKLIGVTFSVGNFSPVCAKNIIVAKSVKQREEES
ncbi:spore germination protein [Sutcliffiella rhizosphaerae]|uniref:Uncharacterized protein n=1 Tax=Sutcliffiella rhizosphaerae TaxID=2880967 RepID=A0ABM8YT79_9BACI|nr:spore germination protein [Sutcliffiella rhizosphaerae]CAG9623232.1 hypothetical protein BACCIP111883_04028 [Sutcliffiella rhizosphaerae]